MMNPRQLTNFILNFNTAILLNTIDAVKLWQEQAQSAVRSLAEDNPFWSEEAVRSYEEWTRLNQRIWEYILQGYDRAGRHAAFPFMD